MVALEHSWQPVAAGQRYQPRHAALFQFLPVCAPRVTQSCPPTQQARLRVSAQNRVGGRHISSKAPRQQCHHSGRALLLHMIRDGTQWVARESKRLEQRTARQLRRQLPDLVVPQVEREPDASVASCQARGIPTVDCPPSPRAPTAVPTQPCTLPRRVHLTSTGGRAGPGSTDLERGAVTHGVGELLQRVGVQSQLLQSRQEVDVCRQGRNGVVRNVQSKKAGRREQLRVEREGPLRYLAKAAPADDQARTALLQREREVVAALHPAPHALGTSVPFGRRKRGRRTLLGQFGAEMSQELGRRPGDSGVRYPAQHVALQRQRDQVHPAERGQLRHIAKRVVAQIQTSVSGGEAGAALERRQGAQRVVANVQFLQRRTAVEADPAELVPGGMHNSQPGCPRHHKLTQPVLAHVERHESEGPEEESGASASRSGKGVLSSACCAKRRAPREMESRRGRWADQREHCGPHAAGQAVGGRQRRRPRAERAACCGSDGGRKGEGVCPRL
eukprot:scaffold8329_cov112-Isochrysis_galbana.AAC.4